MSRWTNLISIQAEPHCPVCCSSLMADATVYKFGLALCPVCIRRAKPGEIESIVWMMGRRDQVRHVSTCHGLLFWTPKSPCRPRVSPLLTQSLDPAITEPPIIDCTHRN